MTGIKAHSRIGNDGQEIYAFSGSFSGGSVPDVTLKGNIKDTRRDRALAELDGRAEDGISSLELSESELRVGVIPFSAACDYELTVNGEVFTPRNVEIITDWADKFEPCHHGDVLYRLYSPEASGARPLILFLHGGGESGTDNVRQIYNCFGAAKLAESYPDSYIMAPQAPNGATVSDMARHLGKMTFANSGNGPQNAWTREYLAKICDLIREMIKGGKVNPRRIYVTGMSMGGAGTLRMLSVGGDLFAAALCICPSMTPETYNILRGLTDKKIWVTCAYLDHTPYRHKYIVDGIMALRDAGNRDAHVTIFSPEDLEKYGISIIEGMSLQEKAGWNHACWVPTYYDEYGALSWMMNQEK